MSIHEAACRCGEETDAEKRIRVEDIIEAFKDQQGNLIQILHLAQGVYGYLPMDIQQLIAERLDLPLSEVYGVSSFYSFFTTQPRGAHTIRVCMGTACYVRGSTKILKRLTEMLDVTVGGTTKDRKFTLEVMRCMGACGLAPAIMIDDDVQRQVKPDKLQQILDKYE